MTTQTRDLIARTLSGIGGYELADSDIKVDTRLIEDLNLDSLDREELRLDLELAAGRDITDEAWDGCVCIGDVAKLLEAE